MNKEKILEAAKEAGFDIVDGDSIAVSDFFKQVLCTEELTKYTELILSTQSPAPSEVKDWVMVPREITPEMMDSAYDVVMYEPDDGVSNFDEIYKAMLSASPTAPIESDK